MLKSKETPNAPAFKSLRDFTPEQIRNSVDFLKHRNIAASLLQTIEAIERYCFMADCKDENNLLEVVKILNEMAKFYANLLIEDL